METDTATTVADARAAGKGLASRDASSQHRQVLYIQMEFCPRTLRDVLDAGPLQEADAWQVRGCCEQTAVLVGCTGEWQGSVAHGQQCLQNTDSFGLGRISQLAGR